jgi:hypothetical protein
MSSNHLHRDGTSQQVRIKATLQPDYVLVDERFMRDSLKFLLQYSKNLPYFNEQDKEEGTWRDFFPSDSDKDEEEILDEILAFIKDPTSFPPERAKVYQQPHFVLLLTFLHLLEPVRTHMNGLTKRHLDFYFMEFLRMQKKKARPDRVNVLVDLAKHHQEGLSLPAYTLLHAGKDSAGRLLSYKTDEDVFVSHAQVAQLRAICVKKEIEGIKEVYKNNIDNRKKSIIEMMKIALNIEYSDFKLKEIYSELKRIKQELNMSFFTFKELVKFKQRREGIDSIENDSKKKLAEDCGEIEQFFKLFNPGGFDASRVQSDYFSTIFNKIISPFSEETFSGIQKVNNVDDLYIFCTKNKEEILNDIEKITHGERKTFLKKLITIKGTFSGREINFETIMKIKIRFDKEWQYIDNLLEKSSQVEFLNTEFLNTEFSFKKKFKKAFPNATVVDVDDHYKEIEEKQELFYMPVYDIYTIMQYSMGGNKKIQYNIIENIFYSSYKEKDFISRKKLVEKYIPLNDNDNKVDFTQALPFILGENKGRGPFDLKPFLPEKDFYFINESNNLVKENLDKIYSILAIAWRNREGSDLVPEKEQWRGLYAVEDIKKQASDEERWRIFGQEEGCQEPGEFGLAISSPVLLLSQGERKITLGFDFDSKNGELEDVAQNFHVFASKEDGWIGPVEVTPDGEKWEITFKAGEEPIAAPISGYDKKWPVLKIIFKNPEIARSKYSLLRTLQFSNLTITVNVTRFQDFKIWNDIQQLDTKKPFELFGPRPIVGSKFYIAHPEFSVKKIDALYFTVEWANELDENHYENYEKVITKNDFKIKINSDNKALFGNEIEIAPKKKISSGTLQWELLEPDFQHSVYPAIALKKAMNFAKELSTKPQDITTTDYIINPPYTPVVKKITIEYTSECSLKEVFHIHPFGYVPVQPIEEKKEQNKKYPFLPQFDNAAELYIGLENFKPPQQLNMLFQLAEGSADADLPPEMVRWDYLSGNTWYSLEKGKILSDNTRGLTNSGIISFDLPVSQPSTLLPSNLYWLRASIKKRPASVCDIIDIRTQAVSATLVDSDNSPDHFDRPLAKETIKKLVYPIPVIKAVHQPYTSFDGKSPEQDKWFYTRVSERLRHKRRALTQWDYEHLVLEYFPQIYKVKCIPSSPDAKPGTVEIVVIPDIRNRLPSDPFKPKASVKLLHDIKDYLQKISPISANIVVKNAIYIPFRIRTGVRFHKGYDAGHCEIQLNNAINKFLAPWAYEEGADIVIGGKIYANSVINFMERLSYVDYVAYFSFHPVGLRDSDSNSINSGIRSVLIPEKEHFFDQIVEYGYDEKIFIGINHWRIELDFVVS